MEENLDINNEVNKEISDNTTNPISEELREPRPEKDINMDIKNGSIQGDSPPNLTRTF